MNTSNGITLQDIISAAWQAFIVEDKPPAVTQSGCHYLAPDGSKCAVGLVLPEGHPAQRRTERFSFLVRMYPELWADDVRSMSAMYLDGLQRNLHDDLVCYVRLEWALERAAREAVYRDIAAEYGLTVPA